MQFIPLNGLTMRQGEHATRDEDRRHALNAVGASLLGAFEIGSQPTEDTGPVPDMRYAPPAYSPMPSPR